MVLHESFVASARYGSWFEKSKITLIDTLILTYLIVKWTRNAWIMDSMSYCVNEVIIAMLAFFIVLFMQIFKSIINIVNRNKIKRPAILLSLFHGLFPDSDDLRSQDHGLRTIHTFLQIYVNHRCEKSSAYLLIIKALTRMSNLTVCSSIIRNL